MIELRDVNLRTRMARAEELTVVKPSKATAQKLAFAVLEGQVVTQQARRARRLA